MKSKTISEWQKEVYQIAKDKGWHETDNEKSFIECLMLIVSELSEAVEEYRNNRKFDEIYTKVGSNKIEGIPVEMADVVIRIFDTCEQFGINLEEALLIKSEYNKTRDYRHGGKLV